MRQKLEENGRTFLNIFRGGHIQYSGPNLHEPEDIDSQVIIDFHAALSGSQDKNSDFEYEVKFGIRSPPKMNPAEAIMVSAGGCKVFNCCENDFILDDSDIDLRGMEDFISDKASLTKDIQYLSDDPATISPEDLILLPYRLFAFVLKDRKWGRSIFSPSPEQ